MDSSRMHKYSMHGYIFFFYVAVASFAPFLGYWLKEINLTGQQIGLLYAVGPLISLAVLPLWGSLCDRFGFEKRALLICSLVTPIAAFGYWLGGDYRIFIVTALLLAVFSAPMGPIADAMTVKHAEKYGQTYGGIRVIGSISFALAVTPIGLLYAHIGISHMFVGYLVAMAVVFASVLLLEPSPIRRGRMFGGVKQLLSRRDFVLFLALTLFVSIGSQCYNVFFGVFVTEYGSDMVGKIGLLNTAAALSELPFFIFARRLVERFGYRRVLAFSACIAALRWFGLSLQPPFWLLIFNQMLHGVTFALFFAAAVAFAHEVSPEGAKTTGQTVFSLVFLNMSALISSNGGGWIVDHAGFAWLYRFAALASLTGGLGFLVLHMASVRRRGVSQAGQTMHD